MRVEEDHMDVLQNIEAAIAKTYRDNPDLSDYDVIRALEVLTDAYSGEKIGRPPRSFRLSDLERRLMEAMREMSEWRLGRGILRFPGPSMQQVPEDEALTVDEIILCLKRISKSVNTWNKEGGRQGYLEFIDEHIV